MPSPLGHVFGGIAAAWIADLVPGRQEWRTAPPAASFYRRAGGAFTLLCGALGAAPDLDLSLVAHRTVTHSLTAVALVTIVAALVTGQVTGRKVRSSKCKVPKCKVQRVARVALMCGAAYATHLLLDWLGIDNNPPRGLQILWPFSRDWMISEWDVFIQTQRFRFFSLEAVRTNVAAMLWETLLLVPVLAALWLVRVKALAGLAAELSRRDHPA